jgi:uncharacterized glyoxalase superfamily metalloenzyme YdcJ
MQHLLIENRVLKVNYNILYVKNAEQQEEINNYKHKIEKIYLENAEQQEEINYYKHKIEKLYVKNANTILLLQEKNNHLNELIIEKNKHIHNIVYQKSFPVNSAPLFQSNEPVPNQTESDLTFEF